MEVEEKSQPRRPKTAPTALPVASAQPLATPSRPTSPPGVAESGSLPTRSPSLPTHRLLDWVDAHRRVLLAGVVLLYLVGFNGQWRLDADSALYLTIGRNLAEGQGYSYHGQHHGLAYPGVPWVFAGLFKTFGTESLVPANVFMLLCGLATLALVYRLFLLHAGRPTAVLMTAAVGLSRTFYRYSFELLSDMPFLMGVMAFLVGYEAIFYRRYDADVRARGEAPADDPQRRGRPRWYDAVLLVAGLAVAMVTRPTMWALLVAVVAAGVLSLFTRPLRRGWVIAGVGAVAVAVTAGVLFYALDPRRAGRDDGGAGDYERVFVDALATRPRAVVDKMLRVNLPEVLHPGAAEAVFGVDWGYLDLQRRWLPLGVVPSLLSIGVGVALLRRRLLWGTFVAVSVAMMLFTLAEVRYFLQLLPLLIFGWWLAVVWLDGRLAASRRLWVRLIPLALFLSMVGVNAGRAAYLAVEQRSPRFLETYRRGKYALVPELTKLLEAQTPPAAWVLVPERQLGRILSYTSGRYAVEPGPVTQLDPELQMVYVLEPLEPEAVKWMGILRLGVGEPVGPAVAGRRGKQWQLHRAVRAPDFVPYSARAPEPPPPTNPAETNPVETNPAGTPEP